MLLNEKTLSSLGEEGLSSANGGGAPEDTSRMILSALMPENCEWYTGSCKNSHCLALTGLGRGVLNNDTSP